MDVLYTAEAVSTGQGRTGHVTAGPYIDLEVAPPTELGGSGKGTNPEQLFAAGYAACFHSALHAVARAHKVKVDDSSVGGRVHLGPNGQGGYQLAVLLEVVLPGIEHDLAQQLADEAHQVCPYSNATRGNIEVTVTVSED